MSQYTFAPVTQPSFALNTQPQLLYLRRLDASTSALTSALCTHTDHAEIVFIENGHSTCTIADETYPTGRGDIVLVNSGVLHSIFHDGSTDITAILLGMDRLHIRGLDDNHLTDVQHTPVLGTGDSFEHLHGLCLAMEYLAKQGSDELLAEAAGYILQAFITELCSLLKSSQAITPGQDYNLGLRIKEFLDAHYLDELRLTEIAEALHVNAYYLSHTFKKIIGYSPMQYITRRRIGEAQNLLITTNRTVTDIALQCGYNNSNYFQVVFNNIVGMPPGKYRKAWK